jgi:hypothetical protein
MVFHLLRKMRAAKARAVRQEALKPLKAAIARDDDRGTGEAFPAAFKATCDELRASVSSRSTGWRGAR